MHTEIKNCRICGNRSLSSLLDLGVQHLTGIFPGKGCPEPSRGPLELVRCEECGLVQLKHSCNVSEVYGAHYGYRSGLNSSMIEHLRAKVKRLLELRPVDQGDYVLDIGANDGTTLSFYPAAGPVLCGMDPSAENFRQFYRPDISLVVDFFSAEGFRRIFGAKARPKIITSIAMFYDLERPMDFVRQVSEILHPQGVWHFEQSYLPLMLSANAYDTICHEHLEYYGLAQVKRMLDNVGLKIVDVATNSINGGSFAVTAAGAESGLACNDVEMRRLLEAEAALDTEGEECWRRFRRGVENHRVELVALLNELNSQGKTVLGYGASTKGNVILQYCGLTPEDIPAIAEVNESKFGARTPGSAIPIISEAEAKAMKPDYFLVLPWHFRDNIVAREREFLASGGKLIFPLPTIEIVAG